MYITLEYIFTITTFYMRESFDIKILLTVKTGADSSCHHFLFYFVVTRLLAFQFVFTSCHCLPVLLVTCSLSSNQSCQCSQLFTTCLPDCFSSPLQISFPAVISTFVFPCVPSLCLLTVLFKTASYSVNTGTFGHEFSGFLHDPCILSSGHRTHNSADCRKSVFQLQLEYV